MNTAPEPDFGILLGLAYEAFVTQLHAELHARGFSDVRGQYGYVFRALDGAGLTVSALAARLGITSQGTTRLANAMEAAGYVRREAEAGDARATRLVLAPRGRAALAAARRFHRTYERRIAREHGEGAARTLRTLLTALVEATPGGAAARRSPRPF